MEATLIGENPIQQQYNDTCAIKSQQIILQEFGIPVSEDQLVQWSHDHGLYNGGGTNPEDVGVLLNQANIPTSVNSHGTIFDLTDELAQGHKVIVGVDSGELWAKDQGVWAELKEWWEDFSGHEMPDHALIVTSIDNSNPNVPKVLVTDPGSGEVRHYPLEQFMDAWKDSGHYMVSTEVSPAEFTSTQVQHNQPSLHLSDIAGANYNDFQLFHDMSNALPPTDAWVSGTNHDHPVSSLMDAYLQYGLGTIRFDDLNQFDFYSHLDPAIFSNNFGDTFHDNYNHLSQNYHGELSDMQNSVVQIHDSAALSEYFNHQAMNFDSLGHSDLADFFHQQVHYTNMCHDLGIDPLNTYATQFDCFNNMDINHDLFVDHSNTDFLQLNQF